MSVLGRVEASKLLHIYPVPEEERKKLAHDMSVYRGVVYVDEDRVAYSLTFSDCLNLVDPFEKSHLIALRKESNKRRL
jgi:hypothetical protein